MKKRLLTVLMMAVLPTTVFAVKVPTLYQAIVPVSSQSDDQRAEAVTQGLGQVLMKVTGDPQIENNALVKPALGRADYYVQEYSYSLPTPSSSHYVIRVRYSKADVNRLLKKSSIAYWGENRPLILVWLAFTNEKRNTEIVGSETNPEMLSIVKEQGEKYGLPLIFPMMDVSDVDDVTNNDILLMSLPTLQEASKRYAPDVLLIGKCLRTEDGFQSQWQLVVDENNIWKWSVQNKVFENVISSVLSQTSQALAKYYIAKSTTTNQLALKLDVSGIAARDDLNQLLQYLKQLSSVQKIQLSQVSGESVQLLVSIQGSIENFMKNAAIGNRLVLKSQDVKTNQLAYEWVH